jgi:hypothetical protein
MYFASCVYLWWQVGNSPGTGCHTAHVAHEWAAYRILPQQRVDQMGLTLLWHTRCTDTFIFIACTGQLYLSQDLKRCNRGILIYEGVNEKIKPPLFATISHSVFIMHVYNKDAVGYSYEQRWFNLFVDIQAQQDAPTQDKDMKGCWLVFGSSYFTYRWFAA